MKQTNIYKFLIGYFVFYSILCFSVPVQTNSWLRTGIVGFFQALAPYLLLVRFFPAKKISCIVSISVTLFLSYCVSYGAERLFRFVSINQYIDESYPLFIAIALYSVLFFFVRYSGIKAIDGQQQVTKDYEAMLHAYRGQLPKEKLLKQLERIEELVNQQSPEALPAIADLSDQLRKLIYQ